MLEQIKFLDKTLTPLPNRPYCSDDLAEGVRIRSLEVAKAHQYLQINPPAHTHYLIFDVDRPMAAFSWEECHIAPPNYAAINPKNGHAHLVYKLKTPVVTSDNGRLTPLRYLASVERAYRMELGADAGYSGLITRNPYKHLTLCVHEKGYELGELVEWLKQDLNYYQEKETVVAGLGRNVTLFDTVRHWAYKSIRLYRSGERSRLRVAWEAEVLNYSHSINAQFTICLSHAEVKATAKSIAKYCWKNDSNAHQAFLERQALRGKRGGLAKGEVSAEKREQARFLIAEGLTQRAVALELAVTERTIRNWLKAKTGK